ncbi:MAG: arginyltransferase [Candidatus Puniceispirillaceae bacterium]
MEQRKPTFDQIPLRMRMTRVNNCAYIEGNLEQRLAMDLSENPQVHDQLAKAGFRRVENWAYKPVCQKCQACMPIRIDCRQFRAGRNLSRIYKSNQDLSRRIHSNPVNEDHYILFQEYLSNRHEDGQMAAMSFQEFSNMIHNSPIDTFLVEYRDITDELIACIMIDAQADGLSAVYSFYDPLSTNRSLGTFMILDMIELTKELDKDYLYLGFYIAQSRKMAYKARFMPSEVFQNGMWEPLSLSSEL